eukprot:10231540-Alexandrium_andersonii.AAC.1
MKLGVWRQPPWCFFALAHHDAATARSTARQALQLCARQDERAQARPRRQVHWSVSYTHLRAHETSAHL